MTIFSWIVRWKQLLFWRHRLLWSYRVDLFLLLLLSNFLCFLLLGPIYVYRNASVIPELERISNEFKVKARALTPFVELSRSRPLTDDENHKLAEIIVIEQSYSELLITDLQDQRSLLSYSNAALRLASPMLQAKVLELW